MRRLWSTCLVIVALPSCAIDHVAFRPREHVDAESPRGFPAASYALADDAGRKSEVRIWSAGVDRDGDGAIVRVGFEIENRFDEPVEISIPDTRVVDVDVSGGANAVVDTRPMIDGEPAAAADAVQVVELSFPLPSGIEPDDVRSFAVRWSVRGAVDFAEHTAFRREPSRYPDMYWHGGFYRGWAWRRPYPIFPAYCW